VRRDWPYLVVILAVAVTVRVYGPWDTVFAADRVDFLETDAWYHIRLIENQVRNWPWRVTLDPYAASGGQFVPIAPFFDTMTATAAVMAYGRDATAAEIERIAVFVPPVLGASTIVVLWALAHRVFDRRAALLGAALLAILPGHFLDRTLLGFYDHHALEACLAMAVLLAFTVGGLAAGVVLGLYLLAWSSGAFLVAILGVWLLLFIPLSKAPDDLSNAARVSGVAALVALIMIAVGQDARMYRYGSQVIALAGLAGIALAVRLVTSRFTVRLPRIGAMFGAIAVVAMAAGAVVWWSSPGLVTQLLIDVQRLAPTARRMSVLEARPLFLYPGTFHWQQPWEFFRTGFFIGVVALVFFAHRVWRERRAIDLLIWVFTAAMFAATIGQNRFGYYLVPACALVGGWLAARVLDWRGSIGAIVVGAGMFAPNLVPSVLAAPRSGTFPHYWHATMVWIREHTPAPFSNAAQAGDEYYYARYPRDAVPPPDYSVMTWWDHGYWITQVAHRVPVANPTQERAINAARFYASADERQALDTLLLERSRYVVIDWELPFRLTSNGAIMGRFQSVLDWAGVDHSKYYQVLYRSEENTWQAVWVFHEPYYRSMTYRLMVLAGRAGVPSGSTSVVVVSDRVDTSGMRFSEIVSQTTYETYAAAVEAAKAAPATGRPLIAGLDPWRPAFPVEPLTGLHELHATRTSEQKAEEAPWVRVFEVR
jgi:asparagine N-glycosylation enzyme membrane subunit Stt3